MLMFPMPGSRSRRLRGASRTARPRVVSLLADFTGQAVLAATVRVNTLVDVVASFTGAATMDADVTVEAAPAEATTWNPSDKGSGVVLSNSDLTATTPSVFPFARAVRAIAGKSSGKWMFQFNWTNTGNNPNIGVGNASASLTANMGGDTNSAAWYMTGVYAFNNVNDFDAPSPGTATCTVCVDVDAGLIWYRKNTDAWNNDAGADPATGTGGFDISTMSTPWYPMACMNEDGNSVTANFGQTAFSFTAPSGFNPWTA